jgi:hypothetical protein
VTEELIIEAGTAGIPAGKAGASVEETLMLLVKRTTDLEMLRVSLFNNCLALANRHINEDQFYLLHSMLMDAVATQIKAPTPEAAAEPQAKASEPQS